MANPQRPLALVTGASAGIGYQLALILAREGFDLIAAGRSEATVTAATDFERLGAAVVPVRVDLASYDGVEQLWKQVEEAGRPLDVAAVNAGVGIGGAPFADTDSTPNWP